MARRKILDGRTKTRNLGEPLVLLGYHHGWNAAHRLSANGIDTVAKVRRASDVELLEIDGIGQRGLDALRQLTAS